jgi:hypothetical protein
MEKPPVYSLISFIAIFAGVLLFFVKPGFGEEDKTMLNSLAKEDSTGVYMLAGYPENLRISVFEASSMPQEIVKLKDIQRQSAGHFRLLLTKYPGGEQLKIWNLTRYEGLIDTLTSNQLILPGPADTVIKGFPKEIYKDAIYYKQNHFDLLLSMNKVKKEFLQSFEALIKQYPPQSQKAFRQLLSHPDLIDLLYNHMLLTVRLGNFSRANPEIQKEWFDTLSRELNRQQAKADSEWNQKTGNDPLAQKEILVEAKEYISANGYLSMNFYIDDSAGKEGNAGIPYPYWCGYPDWVEPAGWFSFAYLQKCGFYLQQDKIFWRSPPTAAFLKWHFKNEKHLYQFPSFTSLCIEYYCSLWLQSRTEGDELVQQWVTNHSKYFAPDFSSNGKERSARLKDYGRFMTDFNKQVEDGFLLDGQQDKFLQEHASAYPHLQLQLNGPANCPEEEKKAHPKIIQKDNHHS